MDALGRGCRRPARVIRGPVLLLRTARAAEHQRVAEGAAFHHAAARGRGRAARRRDQLAHRAAGANDRQALRRRLLCRAAGGARVPSATCRSVVA